MSTSEASAREGLAWVVYTSLATTRFDDHKLGSLLTHSRRNNRARDLTGLLLYREQRFLQAIEGPVDEVWRTFGRISGDPRHHDVAVVVDEPIAARRFSTWSMGYRPWSTPDAELPVGFADPHDRLAGMTDPEGTVQSVRELMEWFRYRHDELDDDGD